MPNHAIGTLAFDQQMRRRTVMDQSSASLGPALATRCAATRVVADRGVERRLAALSATSNVVHAAWVDDRRPVSPISETVSSVVTDDNLSNVGCTK